MLFFLCCQKFFRCGMREIFVKMRWSWTWAIQMQIQPHASSYPPFEPNVSPDSPFLSFLILKTDAKFPSISLSLLWRSVKFFFVENLEMPCFCFFLQVRCCFLNSDLMELWGEGAPPRKKKEKGRKDEDQENPEAKELRGFVVCLAWLCFFNVVLLLWSASLFCLGIAWKRCQIGSPHLTTKSGQIYWKKLGSVWRGL